MNILFAFSNSLNFLILIRLLTGLFNNISIFSKYFILELFNNNEHKKVVQLLVFYQNFASMLAFLLSLISFDQTFSVKLGLNKYYAVAIVIAVLNMLTLIFNFFKMKFKVIIPRRRTQFIEKYEHSIEISNRKESLSQASSNDYDMNKFNNPLKSNTKVNKMNKPNNNVINLDDYKSQKNSNLNNSDFHSKFSETLEQEKEIEFKNNNDDGKNGNSNLIINQEDSSKNRKPVNVETDNNLRDESNLNIKFISNTPTNKIDNKITFINIDEESKISVINNDDKFSNRKTADLSNAKKDLEIVGKNSTVEIKMDDYDNRKNIYKKNLKSNQSLDADTYVNADQNHSNKKLEKKYSKEYLNNKDDPKNLLTQIEVNKFSIFNICLIFSILQVCDVILNNIYLLGLVIPGDDINFTLLEICLFLALLHFFNSILIMLFNSESLNKSNTLKTNFQIFKIFSIVSILFTLISIILPLIIETKDRVYMIYFSIIILFRNLFLTKVLASYYQVIVRITNIKIKEKINNHQNYLSHCLRSIFSFLTCLLYGYYITNNSFKYILVILGGLPIILLFLNLILLKSFDNILNL